MSAADPSAGGGRIGPGRLVLVVGPSGAGKDTLLALAREACTGDDAVVFAQRLVTREASAFEDNASLTPAAFAQALDEDAFALHWEAHGLRYGLPRALDDEIRARRTVVANVSRTVVAVARAAYADVSVVLVTAPAEVLAARLAARARHSDGSLAERVNRSVADPVPDATIINVGPPSEGARELLEVIRGDR